MTQATNARDNQMKVLGQVQQVKAAKQTQPSPVSQVPKEVPIYNMSQRAAMMNAGFDSASAELDTVLNGLDLFAASVDQRAGLSDLAKSGLVSEKAATDIQKIANKIQSQQLDAPSQAYGKAQARVDAELKSKGQVDLSLLQDAGRAITDGGMSIVQVIGLNDADFTRAAAILPSLRYTLLKGDSKNLATIQTAVAKLTLGEADYAEMQTNHKKIQLINGLHEHLTSVAEKHQKIADSVKAKLKSDPTGAGQ